MSIFNRKSEMQISDAELKTMTAELDMLHQETFPEVKRILDDQSADIARGFGRRGFLAGVGGVALIGGLAACSSSGKGGTSGGSTGGSTTPSTGGATTSGSTTSKYTGDLKVVALAAALENLAVGAYTLAGKQAGAGKLGKVPDSVVTFVTTVSKQHMEHAAAWNGVLKQNNVPQITGTPLTIASGAVSMLQKATTVPEVAKQALGLETAAAETYLFATANVTSAAGIAVAATIAPVENMHAAILNFVLGQYPVPVSFLGTDMAVQPSALTV